MFKSQDEYKIIFVGGLILTVLTLVTGFSVFSIMQKQSETLLSRSLEVTLQDKVHLFEYKIQQGILNTRALSNHPTLIKDVVLNQAPTEKNKGLKN